MAKNIRFIAKFSAPTINVQAYLKALDERMKVEIERAAVAWLNAIVLTVIPLWSGASRATFLKLARQVNFPLTVTGISSSQGLIASNPSRWGPRAGFQQSTGKVDIDGPKYTFTWGTSLFHLVFNDKLDANANKKAGRVFASLKQPGPYNITNIGQQAFREHVKAVRLPSPWQVARRTKNIRRG